MELSPQFFHENPLIFTEATKAEVQSQFTKPKMSYAQLIAEALLTGTERMLTLNDIYIAINKQHPYYSLDAASGRNWQNAIRLEMFSFCNPEGIPTQHCVIVLLSISIAKR